MPATNSDTTPDGLWWDTSEPYQFVRVEPHRDHDVVIFGGEDHKTGQEEDTEGCYRRLEERLRAVVPDVELTLRWSGQVIETPDGLPCIGRTADHYPYYLIRDRFAGAEAKSVRAVKRGQGKVIERSGAKVAAYRDADGTVTLRSAICTHMGCTVGWNTAECAWDCPCHGSRFKPTGDVISGPAEAPLSGAE